jgi:flagella basal body P-ring formation protein FlgA
MRLPRPCLLPFLAALLFPADAVQAESAQDLEALRAAAVEYARAGTRDLRGKVDISAGPMDKRLYLPRCDAPEPFMPGGSRLWGRTQVGLRCTAPHHWSVLVPVEVRVESTALFAARPLASGQPLTEADLQVRTVDITRLPAGILTEPAQALGRVPRLSLAAGLPVRGDILRGVHVVAPGQSVSVTYRGDGIQIRAEGKALGAGATGDAVQIRMPSGKVVTGIVTGPGEADVR